MTGQFQTPNIRQAAGRRSRSCNCCRLPADPLNYQDNTLNIHEDMAELDYWLGVLEDQIRTAVEKAISSSDGSKGAALAHAGQLNHWGFAVSVWVVVNSTETRS